MKSDRPILDAAQSPATNTGTPASKASLAAALDQVTNAQQSTNASFKLAANAILLLRQPRT